MSTEQTSPQGDAVLRALGIHRLPMPVPFPDAGVPMPLSKKSAPPRCTPALAEQGWTSVAARRWW